MKTSHFENSKISRNGSNVYSESFVALEEVEFLSSFSLLFLFLIFVGFNFLTEYGTQGFLEEIVAIYEY